jgi:hypothetical protein
MLQDVFFDVFFITNRLDKIPLLFEKNQILDIQIKDYLWKHLITFIKILT